jgi:hypothetical protein
MHHHPASKSPKNPFSTHKKNQEFPVEKKRYLSHNAHTDRHINGAQISIPRGK